MSLKLTEHAIQRMQQRSIPKMLVDWLVDFGHGEPAGNGSFKYYFDKTSRRRFKEYAGKLYGMLEQHLNIYVVLAADRSVVTVAPRCDRIKRDWK
ncbi:hypothetical protein GCM10027046_00060 [Uliginosibacterium flavum]|uniref:DUF4258 domain-containing protein n=1 Tax=Uliginosibacterium flavum TaxID=1396831 RepID=A0ABV2TJK0_9RHOO